MSDSFVRLEALLSNPPASGIFIEWVEHGSSFAAAGIAAGDIIVDVGGTPMQSLGGFFKAMRPKSPDDKQRDLKVHRDGGTVAIKAPASIKGISTCLVAKGECAWEAKPDYEGAPDFSSLKNGVDYWMRNSFGDEPAGIQHNKITHVDGKIQIDIDFCLGGDGEQQWEYYTRSHSVHRMNKQLGAVETSFWDGKPLALSNHLRLGDDGVWRSVSQDGKASSPALNNVPADFINVYAAMLLPMTMPLKKGASLTHVMGMTPANSSRSRLDCIGRETVTVGGENIEAWKFAWRHYGKRAESEDEKIYVNDQREIVRVDWGDHYNNCWCELMPKSKALEGLPKVLALA